MADKKISALTSAATPLAGTEVLPIVQGGSTVKVSVADLTAGRSVSSSKLTASGSGELAKLETSGNVTSGGLGFLRFYDSVGARGYIGYVGTGALQISGSGNVELQPASGSNVLLTGANIVQGTASKGIDFTANTPAAGKTSQLLNAYEEGTWTPALLFDGGMSGSFTYTTQSGTYTKIGRLVTARFNLAWSAIPSAGTIMVMNLPFTAVNAANVQGFISAQGGITNTGTYAIAGGDGLVISSYISTQCSIATVKSGAAFADPLQKSALTSASGNLNGVIIYEVS